MARGDAGGAAGLRPARRSGSASPAPGSPLQAAEQGATVPAGLPPLWGDYSREGGCEVFRSAPPARAGHGAGGRRCAARSWAAWQWRRRKPGPGWTRSTLRDAEIPENLLRIYVVFSGPMSLKAIEKHVHLRDGAGTEMATAFVDVPGRPVGSRPPAPDADPASRPGEKRHRARRRAGPGARARPGGQRSRSTAKPATPKARRCSKAGGAPGK